MLCILCVFLCNACVKKQCEIQIDVYNDSTVSYFYADEKIVPTTKYISVIAKGDLGDSFVVVKKVNASENDTYSSYITKGMPLKIEVEKNEVYEIGILNKDEYQNVNQQACFLRSFLRSYRGKRQNFCNQQDSRNSSP